MLHSSALLLVLVGTRLDGVSWAAGPACPPSTVEISRDESARELDCARIADLTSDQIGRLSRAAVSALSPADGQALRQREAILEALRRIDSKGDSSPSPATDPERSPAVPPILVVLSAAAALSWLLWRRLMGARLFGAARHELDLAFTAVAIGALLFDGWLIGAAVWSARSARQASTVWMHIRPTQPSWPGTQIPKSFEVSVKVGRLWVHPNATEHLWERIGKIKSADSMRYQSPLHNQLLLNSFRSALEKATERGIRYDQKLRVGQWEFIIQPGGKTGPLPTVVHAQYHH